MHKKHVCLSKNCFGPAGDSAAAAAFLFYFSAGGCALLRLETGLENACALPRALKPQRIQFRYLKSPALLPHQPHIWNK